LPATVAAAVAVDAETVACHCCQLLKTLQLEAPAVSVVATAVDDEDTVVAAAVPQVAGQQSVASHCRAAVQQGDEMVSAVISWPSFLQHRKNEVQSV